MVKSRHIKTFELLEHIGVPDESKIPQLIDGLKAAAGYEKDAYCDLLSDIGAAAVPALVGLLSDPDPDIRWHAVHALCDIDAPDARQTVCPALAAALSDSESFIRVTAALGLAKFNAAAAQAVPVLLEGLQALRAPGGDDYDDECTRQDIVHALGEFSPPGADTIRALIDALGDPSPNVQKLAAEALGKHGSQAGAAAARLRTLALQPLPPLPENVDSSAHAAWRSLFDSLAVAAVQALGRIAAEYHEDVLIRLIEDPTALVYDRANAIQALGETPFGEKAKLALQKVVEQGAEPYLSQLAKTALALGR